MDIETAEGYSELSGHRMPVGEPGALAELRNRWINCYMS